ncbi:tryptophan dimethylallyltransferase-domain-containing protein [Xylariaceae sp. AK1471]|nr:tryptophan dimethylallyltransferase-domain-containing protein [Xylariaceae sp. AK1471]
MPAAISIPNQSKNMKHIAKATSVFDQVSQEIQSSRADQAFWWNALGRPLASLLQSSQYNEDDQLYYLQWFHKWIMPALGPRWVDGKPYYGAWLTHDGSCFEYSLNWKEKKSNQTIRFTIEPSSRKAGTAADPLKQLAAKDILTAMAKDLPSIDLKRFNLFYSEICVPAEAADKIRARNPPGGPLNSFWVAFDLEGGSIMVKTYFVPHMKSLLTGVPTKTIVFDAIRKSNGPAGSYDESIAVLNDYLESFPVNKAPKVIILSNDCVVDSQACRNKVYVHACVGTLAHAKDMFHLGGRLSGPVVKEGLKAVDDLWCHLFGLSRSDPDYESKVVLGDGFLFLSVYEMRPTKGGEVGSNMEVKLHIPSWRIGKTDAEIGKLLSTWFKDHGHQDLAMRYQPDLAEAFPQHSLTTTGRGTHTWISITYTPMTGLYMTMYYTPKLIRDDSRTSNYVPTTKYVQCHPDSDPGDAVSSAAGGQQKGAA